MNPDQQAAIEALEESIRAALELKAISVEGITMLAFSVEEDLIDDAS